MIEITWVHDRYVSAVLPNVGDTVYELRFGRAKVLRLYSDTLDNFIVLQFESTGFVFVHPFTVDETFRDFD